MLQVEVTDIVWRELLARRDGKPGNDTSQWSIGEQQAMELYGPLARRDNAALVIGQVGQSLDGRIAAAEDDSRAVSGPDGLRHLHRIRALVDAVVVGAGTALHDDPQLTVRLCDGPQPARVLIDPGGRVPNSSALFANDGVPTIVFQTVLTDRPAGVEVVAVPSKDGRISPREILNALSARGLTTVLIEGGAITLAQFIEHSSLDRLHIAVAPILVGQGPQGVTLPASAPPLRNALRPDTTAFSLGPEVVFDCRFGREVSPTG